jgi:hypothetical protein
VPRPVQHAGRVKGTNTFVGIVKKGDRFRGYVSDGNPRRAKLCVWFRGDIAPDGTMAATDHAVTLAGRTADRRARGTVTLPDGRILPFDMPQRRGGLVERNFVDEGVRYRSGWIVLEDNRVRGHTMLLGEALDGTGEAQPLRLNHGRGSATAYNRLTQVIGFLDEAIDAPP